MCVYIGNCWRKGVLSFRSERGTGHASHDAYGGDLNSDLFLGKKANLMVYFQNLSYNPRGFSSFSVLLNLDVFLLT